ncbi:tyrosine recombinase XerD [Dictyobacter alpinus]|uniref:Tyrosine recombinase XerD n=1 Tax=Dictyobacter alpinus TaxID=2014873 RepID=A0A402B6T9_9CHLR|nr:tyrosine-type recombinase/integrase [Dictyobacter alpinus]GCE27068.1 tyrosine recombinase XerD [Dictyobacter alpinus]
MDLNEVINHFLSDCEIRGLTTQTIGWYRKKLRLIARKLAEVSNITELEQVKIFHLRQLILHLMGNKAGENNPRTPTQDKPLSAFTVRGYVRALKVFFSWCVDEELIASDPSARLVQPKAPEYLIPTFTVDHIEKMLACCDQTTNEGFRNYVLLLTMLDTGMRVSELCGLQVTDVYDRYVKVFGKGRKEREIGLHPEVGKLLWRYIHKYRRPKDPEVTALFLGRHGEALQYGGIKTFLKKVKDVSGVEGVRVSAHTFRHTFAKFYLERGGEVFKLSREMGHSTVQVTELYLKDYRSSEARKEHTSYSPIGEIVFSKNKKKRDKNKDTDS